MGRQLKVVEDALRAIYEAIAREREFRDEAANLSDADRRILHRLHANKRQAAIDAGRLYIPQRPAYLRGLTCGARASTGKPCQMTTLFANGRCIWHGGKSTGPRTPEGRAKALENLKLGRGKRRKSRD